MIRLPYRRARVSGSSMEPALRDGRVVVVRQWGRSDRLAEPGDVILVEDPRDRRRVLLKRVVSAADGTVMVRGDNPAGSTDSRHFGPIPLDHVRGRVVRP